MLFHHFSVSSPCNVLFQLRCLLQSLTFLSQKLLWCFHFALMFHWFLLESHQNEGCCDNCGLLLYVFVTKSSVILSSLTSSTLLSVSCSFLLTCQHCHCGIGYFPSNMSILSWFLSFLPLKYQFSCAVYQWCC